MAATKFGDAFLPWTEKWGLEAGANVVPIKNGYGVSDITWGGRSAVCVPRNVMAMAHVHLHPIGAGDGFSGTLRFVGGRLLTGGDSGDYGQYWSRGDPGYVFRGGDRAGWFFDYHKFNSAYFSARAAGADTYAEWFTRRIR
jgi:hypothetical protein